MNHPVEQILRPINARPVFLAALLVLSLAVWWWISSETRRPALPVEPAGTGPAADVATPSLLDATGLPSGDAGRGNPFTSPYMEQLVNRYFWILAMQPPPSPPVTDNGTDEAPPAPEDLRPILRLIYRGTLRRIDGRLYGLVADPEAGWERFVRTGDELYGLRIGPVTPDQIRVLRGDFGVDIPRGEEREIILP